jgi:HAD superfamily hydrolase (TIGR01509 family)
MPLAQLFERRIPSLYPDFESGRITEQQYWAGMTEAGIAVDPAAFHRARRAGYQWLPGMRDLLEAVSAQVRCVIASNYPDWIHEVVAPLDGVIDAVYASHDLGVRKPDPEFFERLLTAESVPPDQVLFVDDRDRNVEAARSLGMPAIRFTDAASLRAELRAADLIET